MRQNNDYEKYILILGGYGYGNTGDEAQLNETLSIMESRFKDYDCLVLTPNLEYTKNAHNCKVDLAPREAFFDSKSPNTIYWIKNKKRRKINDKTNEENIFLRSIKKVFPHKN